MVSRGASRIRGMYKATDRAQVVNKAKSGQDLRLLFKSGGEAEQQIPPPANQAFPSRLLLRFST